MNKENLTILYELLNKYQKQKIYETDPRRLQKIEHELEKHYVITII